MSKIVNLILLLLILFFYYSFYIYKIKSKSPFFLILFVTFTSLATYILGIVSLLKVSKILIITIGLALFVLSIKDIKNNPKQLIQLDTIMYSLICIVWLFVMTRSAGLSHWDDFSHWYRIAKVLNYDNSLPTTSEILYTTYFPGSACFIYFITRFLPFNVANCLFAQGLIVFGSTSAFLAVLDNKKIIYKLLTALVGTIFLCSINDTFYVLIVDSLIGLVALGTFLLIKYNNNKYDFYLMLLLVSFLSLVKASGILFSIILAIYYIKNKETDNYSKIILFALPLILMAMYLIRNNIVYPAIGTSNQALSLSRFASIGSSKDSSLIFDIVKYYFFSLLNIFKTYQVTLIWISLLIVTMVHITSKENKDYKITLIIFIAYSISLLLVYIFSMDISEANGSNLACFNRYIGTLAIFLFGIAYSNIMNHKASLSLLISTSIIFISLFNFDYLYTHSVNEYTNKMWYDFKNNYKEINTYNTTNYLIIYDENDYPGDIVNKIRALGEAYFRSNYVYAISKKDIDNNNLTDEAITYLKSVNEIIDLTNIIQ